MPLTEKGEKIKGAMEKEYGPKKGEEVFYASKNKGTISGVDEEVPEQLIGMHGGAVGGLQPVKAPYQPYHRKRALSGTDAILDSCPTK